MLQKLNERIKGIIAWIVIGLIAVTFILFGIDYYFQGHQINSDIAVTVNGDAITKQMYNINYRRMRQQSHVKQMSQRYEIHFKKQVLEKMIINFITLQGAKNAGFVVNKAQADVAILNIPQFQHDGHFSEERYKQALSGALYTPQSFQNQVQQGMLLNQQRFAFMGSAFALPNEIKSFVKLYMQTRDYEYILIKHKNLEKQIILTENDIKNYYEKYKNSFVQPEQVSIDYIQLSMHEIKNKLKISDDDLENYYQENKGNYLFPAQWQVEYVLPKSMSNKSYKQVLQLYNKITHDSNYSKHLQILKKTNNPLKWIIAGTTPYDRILVTLTKINDISRPIKVKNGYQILRLVNYKPATVKPFNDVRTEISQQMLMDLAQTRYTLLLERLTDLSYQIPDTLTTVSKELELPIETTKLFTRHSGYDQLTMNEQILRAVFSHDVFELGNNSEPIQLNDDTVVVVRIHKRVPATQQELNEIHDVVKNKLLSIKTKFFAKKIGEAYLKQKDHKIASLLSKYQLSWHQVKKSLRDSDIDNVLINELAFSLILNNNDNYIGNSLKNGDYVIVHLQKIYNGLYSSLDQEQQFSVAQQIEASYGIMDYDLYINSLINTAKIQRQ